jgi:EpsI family protein
MVATAIFLFAAQALSSRFLERQPYLPSPPPLVNLPLQIGSWAQVHEERVDPEAITALGPDDFLARLYRAKASSDQAEVFVAYYKTQLRSKNAHDPKVCLPGAGWNPTASRVADIPLNASSSFPVNYYRIKKDDAEAVVLYWFQTFRAVYTHEQQLKAHRVWDAIMDNRTDMALVRIMVPLTDTGQQKADANATQFAKDIYFQMLSYFPPTEKSGS